MSRADDLRALLARVEEATGRDLHLEAALLRAIAPFIAGGWRDAWYGIGFAPTQSIGDAVALIDAVLPGAYLDMDGTTGKANWGARIRVGDADLGDAWNRPTLALALIAALLSALITQEV